MRGNSVLFVVGVLCEGVWRRRPLDVTEARRRTYVLGRHATGALRRAQHDALSKRYPTYAVYPSR